MNNEMTATQLARAAARSIFVGALLAAIVTISSVLLDAERLWPGFVTMLLMGSTGTFLGATAPRR